MDERMKQLMIDGKTVVQIAEALGLTPGQVSGARHRFFLKLTEEERRIYNPPKLRGCTATPKRTATVSLSRPKLGGRVALEAADFFSGDTFRATPKKDRKPPKPRGEIPPPMVITAMDEAEDMCIYLCSEGRFSSSFSYCGKPVDGQSAYCKTHRAIVYGEPKEETDDKRQT